MKGAPHHHDRRPGYSHSLLANRDAHFGGVIVRHGRPRSDDERLAFQRGEDTQREIQSNWRSGIGIPLQVHGVRPVDPLFH